MILLKVKKLYYEAGDTWANIQADTKGCLITSIDLEDDSQVPIKGEAVTERFSFLAYSIDWSGDTAEEIDDALEIMHRLDEMRMSDPDELRYWFHDVPEGTHILQTSWSKPNADGETYLLFKGTCMVDREADND